MRRFLLLASAVLGAGPILAVTAMPAEPAAAPWPEVARADLDHIRHSFAEDHPGAIDEENPDFRAWLAEGHRQAGDRAAAARDLGDVLGAIRFYVAGFADGHTVFQPAYVPARLVWPGFLTAREGDRFVVRAVAESWPVPLPPAGAELVACDGRPPRELLAEQVLPLVDGRTRLESTYARHAPWLLVRGGGVEAPFYTTCALRLPEGEATGGERDFELRWRGESTASVERQLERAAQRPAAVGIGIEERAPGEHWVHLPTFGPAGGDAERMRQVVERMRELRDARRIVFDVRGNEGGSSTWGRQLVTGLFGEEQAHWRWCVTPGGGGRAMWRVSRGNLAAIRGGLLPQLADRFGEQTDVYAAFRRTGEAMEQALATGELFVPQGGAGEQTLSREGCGPEPANPVAVRTVLLTDGYCGSACLDFADMLLPMPGVVHAGRQTGADTVYMEVRQIELPSGLGSVSLAQKVYRDRRRGHNEPYEPTLRYEGDLSDTGAVERWLREALAARDGADGS